MSGDAAWTGTPRVKGSSEWQRMALLTFALTGLQITWVVEMTYFTPHLLRLGLEKSQTSLVWIAPPLSGLIVQPVVGAISDTSRSRWGRRRPYIMGGSILVGLFLCILAYSTEVVAIFSFSEAMTKRLTVALAVFCIYAVEFAMNAMQTTARCLIIDSLPESQQQLASAWAGRMLGFGHLLGYFVSILDLLAVFGHWLGDSQFKQICFIASAAIVVCSAVTCFCVEERVLVSKRTADDRSHIQKLILTFLSTTRHLPIKIRAVCWITFWSWIGWSPFFVYGTTWVGETFYRQDAAKAQELKSSTDAVGDIARKGSLALVLFSSISFAGSLFLPLIIDTPSSHDRHIPQQVRKLPCGRNLSITTALGLSQMAFAGAMILTPISRSFLLATALIAFCGISSPWAMYGWAPLAIIGEEVSKLEGPASRQAYTPLNQVDDHELTRMEPSSQAQATSPNNVIEKDGGRLGTAGVYLGIWNVYATISQFLATLIAMVTFSILEPGKSPELAGDGGDETKGDQHARIAVHGLSGTAVCLAIGAVCSLVAALRTFRLQKNER